MTKRKKKLDKKKLDSHKQKIWNEEIIYIKKKKNSHSDQIGKI